MPLFGLFPYDDNERRRRLLEDALSPGLPQGGSGRALPMGVTPINPNAPSPVRAPSDPASDFMGELAASRGAPSLPNLPPSRPALMPAPTGPPGGPMPSMTPSRPTRYGELQEAKDVYLQGTPGRFKSAVLGAMRGFGQGLQTGGGLGAGLGGAVAGAGFGGINPRGQREMEFDERVRPRILERFAFEDADTRARMDAEKALREDQAARAGVANINSQIQSRAAQDALNAEKFDLESGQPLVVNPGQVVLDRRTQQPVFTAPPDPRQGSMTDDQAAAALTSELGTVEEESKGSFEGRREMLKKHLTPDELRIIEGRVTKDDDPQTIARAHATWQKIQDDEFQSIRRDTGERRKAKVSQKRFGNKQSASGITRARSEFNSSKYPGARFD